MGSLNLDGFEFGSPRARDSSERTPDGDGAGAVQPSGSPERALAGQSDPNTQHYSRGPNTSPTKKGQAAPITQHQLSEDSESTLAHMPLGLRGPAAVAAPAGKLSTVAETSL